MRIHIDTVVFEAFEAVKRYDAASRRMVNCRLRGADRLGRAGKKLGLTKSLPSLIASLTTSLINA